jgi:O-antigen/teichoic acid export membrane protein
MIFCAADALTLFATVLNPALLAMEETPVMCAIKLATAMVGITTAYLLLPAWSIVGASVGRACAIVLTAILQLLALKWKIRLKPDYRLIVKTLLAGTLVAVVVAGVQLLKYSEFMLPIYVIVGAVVYLMMLRLLRAVDADDFELLRRFLGKRLSFLAGLLEWTLLPSSPRERRLK